MSIVNIRDDDGNIVDSVNIPVSGYGGGSGGNYAPADAIVDQSLGHEWHGARDGEISELVFEWLRWQKRIDGTFTLQGGTSMPYLMLGEPSVLFEAEEELPFDLYDVEYSYTCDWQDHWDISDVIDVELSPIDDRASSIWISVRATDEAFEMLEQAEETEAVVMVYVTMTGKWRID